MYCKFCGKEIDDNSRFCKYCGKDLSGNYLNNGNSNVGIISKFTSLSMKKQITIIAYSVWLLGWICFLISMADSNHFAKDALFPFFIFAIILPFIILCIWYVIKLNKNKDAEVYKAIDKVVKSQEPKIKELKTEVEPVLDKIKEINEGSTSKKIVWTETLMNFARQHGKMQVINKLKDETGLKEHYCLFTSEDGKEIRVEFSDQTKDFDAKKISENKFQLCVNLLEDNSYQLDFLSEKKD